MNQSYQGKITTSIKYVVIAMSMMVAVSTSQADVVKKQIGDLEIYALPTPGNPNIMMMFDISGSMDSSLSGCKSNTTQTSDTEFVYTDANDSTKTFTTTISNLQSCTSSTTNKTIYNRINSLKVALLTLLTNNTVNNDIGLGIGIFSYNGDGKTSIIRYPILKLTMENRQLMANYVAGLTATANTPTPSAFAEAGAYMLGTNTSETGSGFDNSDASTKITDGTLYQQGAQQTTCAGNGIYLLTDGEPDTSVTATEAQALMNTSLSTTATKVTNCGLLPDGKRGALGWGCMANYGQILASNSNATGLPIKTATVGFGSDMAGLSTPTTINGKKIYNCTSSTDKDVQNLCRLGQEFGGGGYYYADSSQDVIDSLAAFMDVLSADIRPVPSGTIVVPDDPYRADSQLAVAYYPILQAEVGKSTAVWSGNLKKYNLNEGTLYGKSDAALFSDIAGKLNPSTEDLWSAVSITKDGAVANDLVTSGGFFSNLKTPDTAVDNIRTLYLEDNSAENKPVIRKFGVTSAGKLTLTNLSDTSGDAISTTNTFNDTAIYSRDKINYLLQFLGFTLTDAQKTQSLTDLVLTAPSSAVKHLGATIHSTPSMVSYSADLDATTGAVTDTRDDYALFGSSDGMVHMVNADNYTTTGNGGRELLAFMPKLMLDKQPEALINGTSTDVGKPYFGVDAPWLVSANYFYDVDNNRVTVTPCPADTVNDPSNTRDCRNTYVRAYGGLRMGGEGMYGLDLTDKNNPKMLFRIDSATTGFDRMGQIWAKPTKAKIATGIDSTTKKVNAYKDVLVFGGGYDTCYEDQGYQVGTTTSTLSNQKSQACNRTTATESLGNAVYMVDAKTGDLIWSATKTSNAVSGATNTTVSTLSNSIVGGITVLDRNNDGYMDQLYFADLGGQVFRADFTNAGFIKPVSSGTAAPETSFSNTRVVRLLQPAFSGVDIKYNHRFYERPAVSFYRGDSSFNNSRLFAVVNVISGDRSSPLSKLRSSDAYADRLYGIMDTDVTLADKILYADDFTTRTETGSTVKVQKINDLATSDLYAFDTTATSTLSLEDKKDMMYKAATSTMPATGVKTKKGWYYPLTRFDGFDRVKYTKGVGKSEVIDSFLYTTVYNPDMNYGVTESCSAKITGGSERQLYCLPYGICLKQTTNSAGAAIDEYATSKNGTAGFARAGQGIQELTLGPRSSTLSNQRLLIGTQTIRDRVYNRVDFGDDGGKLLAGDTDSNNIGLDRISQSLSGLSKTTGDGSAPENIYNDRYTLKPNTWFEVNK
ncbi:pilus assembly protein PilY [Moraxella osloensis]|uniref:Pilus assembly protein PilY n=1 Tax=Faucicola osloensis TaxID=34062 RepID=A0A6P1KIV1_FAUOS|nr:pilus assembly protein PilY [Moraxella osloensis]QHG09833.1 pilus assembly protein PilY [Moraxella osloensis]